MKSKRYKLSKLISRIFDAPQAIFIILYIIWAKSPIEASVPSVYFLFACFYLLIIPILIILLLIQLGVLDNWELTEKSTRKYAYLIGFVITLFTLALTLLFDVPLYFRNHILLAIGLIVTFGIITNFTNIKVSLHISSWTGVIFLLSSYFSLSFLFLIPLLFLIGYARYTIKNHTLTDMFSGYFMTLIVLFTFIVLSNT